MATTSINPQTNCPIMRLPRELRGTIYEYTFAPTLDSPIDVQHATEAAPAIDLTITCRLFHEETMQLHQTSYRVFWSQNTFIVSSGLIYEREKITERHIEPMRHILVANVSPVSSHQLHLHPTKNQHPILWDATLALGSGPDWQSAILNMMLAQALVSD